MRKTDGAGNRSNLPHQNNRSWPKKKNRDLSIVTCRQARHVCAHRNRCLPGDPSWSLENVTLTRGGAISGPLGRSRESGDEQKKNQQRQQRLHCSIF